MAEWLYEAGIGEARAALVDDGRIIAARIERDDALTVGTVLVARLIDATTGRVAWAGGEALLTRPARVTQGAALSVEIVREAIPEPGRPKLPRAVPTDGVPRCGPTLLVRLAHGGDRDPSRSPAQAGAQVGGRNWAPAFAGEQGTAPVRHLRPHEPDALEAAGWSEVLEEARTGEIAFAGGALRMTPTPAMTLFDVDGTGDLAALAQTAAAAVALAIVRHDVGGSIGIDFPTLAGKAARQAVAGAIDVYLPPPFERTAVNGFGFLQIVRPRPHPSLPELIRADPVRTAASAALRTIERTSPPDRHPVTLPAKVRALIEGRPDWLAEVVKRTGAMPMFTP